jgi:hypothetical protein
VVTVAAGAVAQAFHGATEALQSRWPLVEPPA